MVLQVPLNGSHRRPQGTCFSNAVSTPIKDISCLTEQVVLDRRELNLKFRASHLSGLGLTTP